MLVATKLNREQVMLGSTDDKNIPNSVGDANAVKGASAMSKGAPPAKPNPSLIESSQSLEGVSPEQMTRNEAKIWQEFPTMHWSDVAIKSNNHSKCRLLKNFYAKLNPSSSSEDLEDGQAAVADAYLLQYGPKTLAAL
jgi:hypothetical protein